MTIKRDIPKDEIRQSSTVVVGSLTSKRRSRADFICVGEDDQKNIQEAIASLHPAGGKLTLLDGEFVLSDEIVAVDGLCIEGQGYATKLKLSDKTKNGISIDGKTGVSIRNLRIDGNRADTDSGEGQLSGLLRLVAIAAQSKKIVVENVWLENAYSVAICANSGASAEEILEDVFYHNIHTKNCNWDLLLLGGDEGANRNRLIVDGFFSEDTLRGISCGTMNGCIFRNLFSTTEAVYGGVCLDSCRNFRFAGGNIKAGGRALCIVSGSCTSYGISFEDFVIVKGVVTAYLDDLSYGIYDIRFRNIRHEGGVGANFDFHTHATPQEGASVHDLWLEEVHSDGATERDFSITGVAATPLNQVRLLRCTAKSGGTAENYTFRYIDDLEMIGCDGANGTNVVVGMTNVAYAKVLGGYFHDATVWNLCFDLTTVTNLLMEGVRCGGEYAVVERGASNYNTYRGNNWRNIANVNCFLGAHNVYDLEPMSVSLDLSGAAIDIPLFHADKPCVLAGIRLLYVEASSADAGVDVRIGRFQDGVALDDDYFDVSVSEVSKALGYSKFFDTEALTSTKILAGDTVTIGTAGGKTGTGEVRVILHIAEMAS